MGEHYFCDVCRWLDSTKKGATDRVWRIEDTDFILHMGTHTPIELIVYAIAITQELYHNNARYEVDT